MNCRFLIVGFCISLSHSLFAATYYVSPSGQNGASGTLDDPLFLIQDAINLCQSTETDSVLLVSGTYWQSVGFADKQNIFLMSADTLNPSTISGSGVEATNLIEIGNCDGILIKHLIFREHYIQGANAIYIHGGGTGLGIQNCEFFDIGWGNDPGADPESYDPIRQAHAILINGNAIPGLYVMYITNNYFHNIIVGNSEAVTITGNVEAVFFENNTIVDVTNIGIVVAGHYSWAFPEELDQSFNQARSVNIMGNTFHNCLRPTSGNDPAAIYVDGGKDVVIYRNEVYDNGVGISVGCENTGKTAKYVTVADNVVYNNDKFGMVFGANSGNIENCTVRNNTFFNNGIFFDNSGSISIQKCTDSHIRDNIVYLTSADYYGISTFGYFAENLTVSNNLLYSTAGETDRVLAISPADGSSVTVANLPFQDPLLTSTDVDNPDFHLLEGSPCINQGNPFFVGFPEELDFYGNPRVVQLVDIGAAESDVINSVPENESSIFELFPNPTSGISTIGAKSAIRVIRIYTLSGKRIETIPGNGSKSQSYDFGSLDAGFYFLEISTRDQISTRKIIVQ